jgi:ketosteroid isomerase-like protein
MSRENLQRLERLYGAWNREDFEAFLEMVHHEVEWFSSGDFPGLKPVYRGRAEVLDWWNDLRDPWEYFTITVDRVVERENTVVAVVDFEAVGKESGARTTLPFVHAFRFENGLIRWYRPYRDLDEALEAVGLSE